MKFGQGVYWGDGGWRAQIMGVSGGRLTAGGGQVAGRACPAPTEWRKEAGGVNFPTTTKEERRASPLLIYMAIAYFLWYILSSSS